MSNEADRGQDPDVETQQSSTEESGAQDDDLDTLLSQFDQETNQTTDETSAKGEQPDETTKRLQQLEERVAEDEYRKDITNVIQEVRGGLPEEVLDDTMIEGWLDAAARKDTRLRNAWLARKQKPEDFDKVKQSLAKDFQKKFGPYFQDSDKEAVASAVRSASKAPQQDEGPSEQQIAKMSDKEYQQYKRKLLSG